MGIEKYERNMRTKHECDIKYEIKYANIYKYMFVYIIYIYIYILICKCEKKSETYVMKF